MTQLKSSSSCRCTSVAPAATSRFTSLSRCSVLRSRWTRFLPGVGVGYGLEAELLRRVGQSDDVEVSAVVLLDATARQLGPPGGERSGIRAVECDHADTQCHRVTLTEPTDTFLRVLGPWAVRRETPGKDA